MRRGYTLIEIIITIAITGILSVGMFKALEAIAIRSEKAKTLTVLSLDSQSALDQISLLLYDRAPTSLVGFDLNDTPPYQSLGDVTGKTILEWYGLASESYNAGDYSSFIDINRSDAATKTLYTPNTDLSVVIIREKIKWGDNDFNVSNLALVFPSATINHYPITESLSNTITLAGATPHTIYEKYYLVDSAYAITRKEHASSCFPNPAFDDNALLLFYNYRPWKGESFCDGNVTLLATDVNAFRAEVINGTIRLSIDMNRSVRGSSSVRLSKQKVVF